MEELEITEVEAYVVANPWKPWVFVRIKTNTGIHGIGEAKGLSPKSVVAALGQLQEHVIGMNPFHTEQLFGPMYPAGVGASPDRAVQTTAIAAIDIACWDIKGKYLDVPLYNLLGGPVQEPPLRTYANGWYTDVHRDGQRSAEAFAEAATNVVDEGYDALKFDPFGSSWRGMDRSERNRSIDIVEAVREAVGPDVDILIEGHGRFDSSAAIEIARRLEPYEPGWFEEPTPSEPTPLGRVADATSIPIASGEREHTHHGFRDLLSETGIGVVQPDVVYSGGITQLQKIATVADNERVRVAPHNAQSPLSTAVTAHIDATLPNFMIQEVFGDFAHPTWAPDLFDTTPTVTDGKLHVPTGPGIGMDLNVDAVREHAYSSETADDVDIIHLFEKGWEGRSFKDS